MWLKSANNAKWLILGTVLASAGFITIKDSKGTLFPSAFPYRVTLTKVVNSAVTQREIVEVTNRSGNIFTVTRAVEACPASDTATTQTTTAFAFADNDSFQINRTNDKDVEVDAEILALETDKLDKADYLKGDLIFWASSTGDDDYSITVDSGITVLTDWQPFRFLADVANTGTATLNVNSIWAKTILKANDNVLQDWDIEANQIVEIVYNSGDDVFEMTSQIATLPTVDIFGLTEKSVPVNADDFIMYDSVAMANKKIGYDNLKSAITDLSLTKIDQLILTRLASTASGTVNYSHSLGVVPKLIIFTMVYSASGWSGGRLISAGAYVDSDNTNNTVFHIHEDPISSDSTKCIKIVWDDDANDFQDADVSAVTTTNFSLNWTFWGWAGGIGNGQTAQIHATLFA